MGAMDLWIARGQRVGPAATALSGWGPPPRIFAGGQAEQDSAEQEERFRTSDTSPEKPPTAVR